MYLDALNKIDAEYKKQHADLITLNAERKLLNERFKAISERISEAKAFQGNSDAIQLFLEKMYCDSVQKKLNVICDIVNKNIRAVLPDVPGVDSMEVEIEPVIDRSELGINIKVKGTNGLKGAFHLTAPGSVDNIVSIIFRAILIMAMNQRRLMLLDESDHWIRPNRARLFFAQVFNDLCMNNDFQIINISHHNLDVFEELDNNIIEVCHNPKKPGTAIIKRRRSGRAWRDDEIGIRQLELVNIGTFEHGVLEFSPGNNIIYGDNGVGKSRVTRALWALIYGGESAGADLVMNGKNFGTVAVYLEKGRILCMTRKNKGAPALEWCCWDENKVIPEYDGEPDKDVWERAVLTLDGVRCKGGGIKPPQWVSKILGTDLPDGANMHISHQRNSSFLINESKVERARILNPAIQNYLPATMMTSFKNMMRDYNKIIKDNSKSDGELETISARLNVLNEIMTIAPCIEELGQTAEDLKNIVAIFNDMDIVKDNICGALEDISLHHKYIDTLSHIPEFDAASLEREINAIYNMDHILSNMMENERKIKFHSYELQALSCIPEVFSPEEVGSSIQLINRIEKYERHINILKQGISVMSAVDINVPDVTDIEKINSIMVRMITNHKNVDIYKKQVEILKDIPVPIIWDDMKEIDLLISRMDAHIQQVDINKHYVDILSNMPDLSFIDEFEILTRSDNLCYQMENNSIRVNKMKDIVATLEIEYRNNLEELEKMTCKMCPFVAR